MDQDWKDHPQASAGTAGRTLGRLLLAALGAGLLWLAWIGYSQPGLLLQWANLRYCG